MKFKELSQLIREKILKTQAYYSKYGLSKSILYPFKQIRKRFKRLQLIFFEIDLKEFISCHKPDKSIIFSRLKKEDIEKDGYHGGWLTHEEALNWLEKKNCILFVLKNEGKIVCYHWIEFRKVDLSFFDLSIFIDNKTVYSSHLFTVPGHRGKGFASEIKSHGLKYLKDQGYRKVFLAIVPENAASIRVNKKSGFKEYQSVTYIKILFLKFYIVNDWQAAKRKFFFYFNNEDNKMWKTFSNII